MPTVCLPSISLRDDVLAAMARKSYAQAEILVMDGPDADPSTLLDVEFWVPGFLMSSAGAFETLVSAMPALKVVQTQSAGVDRFVGHLPEQVLLCDARGVHGSSTSEWALTAILSMLREFPKYARAQQQGRWLEDQVTEELANKTVLIIGAGDVGQALARRVAACDARPVLVARTPRDGVRARSELPELLPQADVVVLIVPQTSETVGMVDSRFLQLMRDGALLVNAARGPVLDTDALVAELQSGRIMAALDVTDPEPLPPHHPLWHAPNLLLTPHVGGSVTGFQARVARLIADQLVRFEAGQPLINVVVGQY